MWHCFAVALRKRWWDAAERQESSVITFDGHKSHDDVHFSLVDEKLEITQGLLGLALPYPRQTVLDMTSKSERSATAIWSELKTFAIDGGSGRDWKYDRGIRQSVVDAFQERCHFIASDRCAEAQLTAKLLCTSP